ncbi:MAG: HAMP domain-containing histidine kinase [Lachnospiraceae bacterium]|nr:HAMP domain-containing histidine kinase [Lachnospiraceae bacterium]
MKNYSRFVIVLFVLYFTAVIIVAVVTGKKGYETNSRDEDVLKLNDIARDVEDNWYDLNALDSTDYGVVFTVIDLNNEILYETNLSDERIETVSVENAIKNRYPYACLTVNEKSVGYVIMADDGLGFFKLIRLRLIIGLLILGLGLFLLAFLYGRYIDKSIIIPFKNMKSFAGKIAEGNLDEPLMMDKGNMFGAFSESFDIMREELSESRKREIALQKKERELVASLSHDLKTPITGIKLTTELLKAKLEAADEKNENTGDIKEKLDNIYKKADQIDVLVSDLFSSVLDDLGEFKVSLSDEESKVLTDIVKKYDDKNLAVSSSIPDVLIRIDLRRMSQVIGNIISNSYKYAGTRIDIDYRIEEEFLQMRIHDHGPGVPEDELSLIANKFYRGRDWEKSSKDGSGLGLYIAKMLMEKMNGEMLPESNGDGLIITLLIPLC